eukprot:2792424-Pyramimonas_sp.AAC.1
MLGFLGPSWDCLEASWKAVGCYLEPCLAIVGHVEGRLGLSGAILEPSWAKKGGAEGLWGRLGGLLGPSWAPWLKKGSPSVRTAPLGGANMASRGSLGP